MENLVACNGLKYNMDVKEPCSVVFTPNPSLGELEIGVLFEDKIYYRDGSAEGPIFGVENVRNFLPLGGKNVEAFWEPLSSLWMEVTKVKTDPTKRYRDVHKTKEQISEWDERWNYNWKLLQSIDKEQKEAGEKLYRYITFPYADGKAVYQVVGICGDLAKIESVKDIGDDYTDPFYGDSTVLPMTIVSTELSTRDLWSKELM